jgi:hypothetical protein
MQDDISRAEDLLLQGVHRVRECAAGVLEQHENTSQAQIPMIGIVRRLQIVIADLIDEDTKQGRTHMVF